AAARVAVPVGRPPTCLSRAVVWILDLDGVVWLADEPIPGAPEAIGRLRAARERVVFLTNNSSPLVGDYIDKLRTMGIDAGEHEVMTSAQAAAAMLAAGTTALVCGGPGVREALQWRGVLPVRTGN